MDSFSGLLNNAVLLLALGVVYDSLGLYSLNNRVLRKILTGVLVGVIGISVMLNPWEMKPGVFFDTRWVLISLCGLYFGWMPTLIAVLMTVTLRFFQGGVGVYPGMLVIITSGLVGLGWRYWSHRNNQEMSWGWLYLFGLSVQINVLFCVLFMPAEIRFNIMAAIAFPLLTIYPFGTMLLAMLLKRQKERRQFEEELHKNKKTLDRERGLLKRLIDSIPDYIFYKSVDGRYLGCNKATAELFKTNDIDIVGKTDFDFFDHEQAMNFRQSDQEVIRTGKNRNFETIVTHPDGRVVQLDSLKTPFYSETGKLYGLIGIGRDVTDKQAASERIRKSETTYRSVLSTALDGFIIFSIDGVVKDVNDAYVGMSGYTRDELLLMRIDQLDALESKEETKKHIQQIMQGKQRRFSSQHRRKNNSIYDVEVNVTFWPEDGGKIFVFIKDVTKRKMAEQQLLKSEARFRQVFENMPTIAVQGYDKNRHVLFWNAASEKMYGYSSDQALGKKLEDLIVPSIAREQAIEDVTRWLNGGEVIPPSELILQKADGTQISVLSSHIMITGANDEPEMYCVDLDLTALRKAEEKLLMLSQAVEQSPISVVLTDTDGVIEYVNSTFKRVTGYSDHEVVGTVGMLKSEQPAEIWAALLSGESWQGEFQNIKKSGELFWEHVHIAPVTDDTGVIRHLLAVNQDITQQKEQEQRIIYQAHYDNLTGLPNRFLSMERLTQMLKEAQRTNKQAAVCFLDLDDFKKVNDTLGHKVGDELLVEAATRLKRALRDGDVVGRLGGDEFIVLLSQVESSTAISQVAEKILEQFRVPFSLECRELISTTSIGIAVYPTDGKTSVELLKQADAAMYHSKEQGCNTYNFYTQKMNDDVARRLLIEEQLRVALKKDELHVFYQPVVDLHRRVVIGAEALLRWNNSEMGNVTPDEFIPVAEQTGLIVAIGNFVLEQACIAAAQWREKYHFTFHIAVNISPRQFRDSALVDDIQRLLTKYALPASCIELEITEGVLMTGHSMIDEVLSDLNKMGMSISMDDFGTGYSSLSYLRSYPFDTLKIDKSFINDITHDHADFELVNAAVAMGQGLGLKVIAEGVETEEQYQLLLALKCDYGQGYLFSRPVPFDEFEVLLKTNKCAI